MTYKVEFRPSAAKQLSSLPKGIRRTIMMVVDALADNPRPSGAVRLKGTGFLRVRMGDYRVVYDVQDSVLRVLVVRIAHRREVYRNL